MIRSIGGSRAAQLLAGILVLVILVLGVFTANMYMRYQRYQAEIESMQPRMAQLEGIFKAHERIKTAAADAERELAEYVYPAVNNDATLNSEIQNRARSVFSDAGMQVSGSQILPARPSESVAQLRLDLSATGSLDSLEAALLGLKKSSPQILVENLRIEPVRAVRNNDTQSVQVNVRLFVFREGGR